MSYKSMLVSSVLAASAMTVVGCAPERHDVVPDTAMLGAEGEKRLSYMTDGPGTLYIYDQTDSKLLYSGQVESRRQVTVDPERNEVSVDGVLVQDKSLRPGNNRKIYFEPTLK